MRQIVLALMLLAILPGTAQTQHPAKQERAVVYDDVTRGSDADDRDWAGEFTFGSNEKQTNGAPVNGLGLQGYRDR